MTASLSTSGSVSITQVAAANSHFATVELATGVTLNYMEQGDKGGEAIIVLHGYSDSWNTYALALPHFSPENNLFVLDQRGHGDSSKAECCYAMDDFAADVVAFMDAKGLNKATVVGHSMGSMIAQLVAIHYPDRVDRLVLIGSMTVGGNPALIELNEVVQTFVDPVDPGFVRDFQMSTGTEAVPQVFIEKVVAESLKVPAHVWRQALASFVEQETTHDLHRISAPTLIMWGDQDPYFPRSDQETLATLIPQAQLHVYKQVSHNPHWERPQQFVNKLEQFLETTRR